MLKLKGITKAFPGVKALDDVSITFHPGEIHALLGENGAGKSTTIKIISGIYRPDSGEVLYNSEPLDLHSYRDGLDNGISIVNQEIQVIHESSIAENIMLDKMITYKLCGMINWKEINQVAQKYMDMVGLNLPPTTIIADLSAAHKQLVQIAKALASNAKILLLDEPTSSITNHEADTLFGLINELKKQGVIIIFVTHRLNEVFAVSDRITVLRDGCNVGTKTIDTVDTAAVVKMMIGRETHEESYGTLDVQENQITLETRNMHSEGKIHNANFTLHKGEILGFYGLVGSGRTETARLLIGEDKITSGEIFIKGEKVKIKSVTDSLYSHSMGYVTENRKEEGLLLESSIKTNVAITVWSRLVSKIFRAINLSKESEIAENMIATLDIRTTGPDQITENLSGGNQQKVSIAKWLAATCDILIIDEPTVGVDIGAKNYIHKLIWDLAADDKISIILISSDMPEIIKLSSRLLVFKEHEIVGEIDDMNTPVKDFEGISKRIGHHLA